LATFFKENGHYATEEELLAIIRRIDLDGDAEISKEEFYEFL
jgi:Ca2+-binding EF-hand superfamily protein